MKGRCKYKMKDGSCWIGIISGYCDEDGNRYDLCEEYEECEDND